MGLWLCGAFLAEPAAFAQEIQTGARLGVATLYDDNLLRENDLRPIPRSADVRITPTLNLDLKRNLGRHHVFLKGDAGYDFHRRNSRLDAERIALTGGGRAMLGARCRMDLSVTADFQQTDIADLGVVEANRTRLTTYDLELACPKVAGLYPVFTASRSIGDNSSKTRRTSDTRSYTLGGAIVYARPSFGNLGLFYSYSQFERPGIQEIFGVTDKTDVHRGGVQYDRDVAARIRTSLAVNAIIVKASLPSASDYKGVGWEAELGWTPTPARSLTLTASRDVRGESSLGVSYIVHTTVKLVGSWRLSAKTVLGARLGYARRSLRGEDPRPGLAPRGADTSKEAVATLRYAVTQRMSADAEIGHARRNARNDFYDYRSTRAGLRLSYRF